MRQAMGHWLETLWQDLRYGLRMLGKHPGFTLVGALTLAFGLGANTAVFSTIDALLFHPFDFLEFDRLVMLSATKPHEKTL